MLWLLVLGREWVSIYDAYATFNRDETELFFQMLDSWHDGAYISKRMRAREYEEYRLTKKALTLLGNGEQDETQNG